MTHFAPVVSGGLLSVEGPSTVDVRACASGAELLTPHAVLS